MKLTDEQIKQAYEREGGPDLHPNRATDTGLSASPIDIAVTVLSIIAGFAVLMWLL